MTNVICSCQSDEKTIAQAGERFRAAAPHTECARTEAARLYIQCIMNMMASGIHPNEMDTWVAGLAMQHKQLIKIIEDALAAIAAERKLK